MTDSPDRQRPKIIRHVETGQICCDPQWEDAYRRFETPEEEIRKFIRRLRRFGFEQLPRDARIVEIFCGRGNGLVALERMGFEHVEGVDLSDSLLEQYSGTATLHLADCLDLPFDDHGYDIVIVQGGLHHLPKLPDDLETALQNVVRILKPHGRFYVVEPWRTPFLTFVHAVTDQPFVRKLYAKGDALAAMTERERETYEEWLSQPERILKLVHTYFTINSEACRWGKLCFSGSPRGSIG